MNKLFSSISTESSLSVEHKIGRLALEANVITNAVDTLRDIIPDLGQKFKNIISSFKVEETPSDMLVRKAEANVDSLKSKFGYSSFATFDKTLVTVPEGFHGNFLRYGNVLQSAGHEVYANAEEILDYLKSDLSVFISNKENKQSVRDRTAFVKKVKHRREQLQKELGDFFSDKHVRSKAYMTEVIDNFEQIDDVNDKNKAILKVSNQAAGDKISRMSQEIEKLLNIVIEDISTGDASAVSGVSARNISEAAYEAAECVALVGIYRFRVHQLVGCTHELTEQLTKALK